MGARDGVKISNTYFFNQYLDWKGVLIEPGSEFRLLRSKRPNDILYNVPVCRKPSLVSFADAGAVGGIEEQMAPSFRARWSHKHKRFRRMKCVKMTSLMRQQRFTFFDFFSLDVEGGELEVLQSIDFKEFLFGIIVVETDHHSPRRNAVVKAFLHSQGYIMWEKMKTNSWFMNKAFWYQYSHLIP